MEEKIIKVFLKELTKFSDLPSIPPDLFKEFKTRITNGKFTKNENPVDHFCSMFLPYNKESHSVYLVHHKKANDWIAPGGHLELNETPLDTLFREFKEELDYEPTNFDIKPLYVCNIHINNDIQSCKIHYDFWYLVHTPQISFHYEHAAFYDARWFTLEEALNTMKQPVYIPILQYLDSNKNLR